MKPAALLALASLILGLVGSVILAYSLNEFLAALRASSNAHDFAIEQLAHDEKNILLFGSLDKLIKRGERSGRRRTVVGALFVGCAVVLQAVAVIVGP
jgi:hypothetical protein